MSRGNERRLVVKVLGHAPHGRVVTARGRIENAGAGDRHYDGADGHEIGRVRRFEVSIWFEYLDKSTLID